VAAPQCACAQATSGFRCAFRLAAQLHRRLCCSAGCAAPRRGCEIIGESTLTRATVQLGRHTLSGARSSTQDTDGPAATARLPMSRQLRLRSEPQQLNCATKTCQLASTLLSPFVHSDLHSTHLTTLQREGGWRQASGKTPRGGCAAPSLYMFCPGLGARHLCSAPLCQAHVRCILQYACPLGAAARRCLESAACRAHRRHRRTGGATPLSCSTLSTSAAGELQIWTSTLALNTPAPLQARQVPLS